MKIKRNPLRKWYLLIIVLLIGGMTTMNSCRRARYRRMIKMRRAGFKRQKRHKGAYQRKLRKKAVHTNSTYYIKQKRNYRRRPWYSN